LLKGFCAGLNGFDHGAFADLIAQARGLEIFDDRLFSGFAFEFVDGEKPSFAAVCTSLAQIFAKLITWRQ
jgi:hypothetical protein